MEEAQKSRYAIGDERFRAAAETELRNKRTERAEMGDIVWPEDRPPSVAEVAEVVMAELGVTLAELRFHGHRMGQRKALAVELCCRLSGATQREVGRYFKYGSEASVGKARQRVQACPDKARDIDILAKKVTMLLPPPIKI